MSSEPEWTKQFSNNTVCNFYYYISVAVLVIGFFNIFILAYVLMAVKTMRVQLSITLVSQLIMLALAYFIYLFLYLMCTRSLNK
jgi:hypothetical protein